MRRRPKIFSATQPLDPSVPGAREPRARPWRWLVPQRCRPAEVGAAIALAVIVGLVPASAGAWGARGHAIVCEVAYAELNPATRAEVDRLLRDGRRGMRAVEGKALRARSFGKACAWPDREPRRRGQAHYINTPRGSDAIAPGDCGENQTCLLDAIASERAVLRDPEADDRARLAALMYLGHWIGDLHQPLHVSYADDRGGNDVGVGGAACPRASSLHAVWDHCLVAARLGRHVPSPRRVARRLVAGLRASQRAAARASLDPDRWANESYALVREPSVGYCDAPACPARAGRRVVVDGEYLRVHGTTAEDRLVQAGLRLAATLDDLLRP